MYVFKNRGKHSGSHVPGVSKFLCSVKITVPAVFLKTDNKLYVVGIAFQPKCPCVHLYHVMYLNTRTTSVVREFHEFFHELHLECRFK